MKKLSRSKCYMLQHDDGQLNVNYAGKTKEHVKCSAARGFKSTWATLKSRGFIVVRVEIFQIAEDRPIPKRTIQ